MMNEIICNDCIDVMKSMPDKSVDLILTDPPYKLTQTYGTGVDSDNLIAVANIMKSIPEMYRILKPGRYLVCCYDNRILPFLFEATKHTQFTYTRSIYLYRKWGLAHRVMGWMQCTDPIAFFVTDGERFNPSPKTGKVKHDCYIKVGKESDFTGHPAQKPLELFKDIISWCSKPGEVVFDPYVGSGTSCLAAKILNRNYIGIDNSEKYCDDARRRINQKTIL